MKSIESIESSGIFFENKEMRYGTRTGLSIKIEEEKPQTRRNILVPITPPKPLMVDKSTMVFLNETEEKNHKSTQTQWFQERVEIAPINNDSRSVSYEDKESFVLQQEKKEDVIVQIPHNQIKDSAFKKKIYSSYQDYLDMEKKERGHMLDFAMNCLSKRNPHFFQEFSKNPTKKEIFDMYDKYF